MVHMIKRLRAAGKKTFLLTNSLWDYTNVVMNFLVGNEADARTTDWVEDLFDIVIVGACKPGFLVDPFLSLFRVNTRDNTLTNTDGIIGDVDVCLQNGRVFQGGNWQHLHEMLKLHSGDRLLYVGDHMFSDILRSKRTLGWRTCLIVPELEMELIAHGLHAPVRARINELREYQYRLDEEADRIRFELLGQSKPALEESLALVEAEQAEVKERLRIETLDFHHLFHPQWGQLFKSGYQDSRFAAQVTQYACIYTAKASNLYQMSGRRSFRAVRDFSAHDFRLESSEEVLDPELM
jgi:5'-nucleotidase